jgi:hypothetical protein
VCRAPSATHLNTTDAATAHPDDFNENAREIFV